MCNAVNKEILPYIMIGLYAGLGFSISFQVVWELFDHIRDLIGIAQG